MSLPWVTLQDLQEEDRNLQDEQGEQVLGFLLLCFFHWEI
jgi:hypothetical protein